MVNLNARRVESSSAVVASNILCMMISNVLVPRHNKMSGIGVLYGSFEVTSLVSDSGSLTKSPF